MAQYGGARDPDSFYVQDCRQVQHSTHAIQTLAGQIARQVGMLATEKDFEHCRSMVDDAVRSASETRAILSRIREHQHQAQNAAERNNRRVQYQKLSDNLAVTARVLEDVIRRFQAEETRRAPLGGHRSSASADADVAGGDSPMMSTGAGLGMGRAREHVESLEEELATEKCQALRRLDADMRCLQQIYTDLATAAEDAQSSFDSLETHMAGAAADLERGREEISIAGKYGWGAKAKRKLVVVGTGVLATFAVFAYITSG